MALKHVVLPAPFGPMRPKIWPVSIENETASSATTPPKRIVTSPSLRRLSAIVVLGQRLSYGLGEVGAREGKHIGALRCVSQLRGPATSGQNALWPEDHHHDKRESEQEDALVL